MHEIPLIPLGLLRVGQRAEVQMVVGADAHSRRLQELGFRQGVAIEVVRSGDPCIIRLENSKFCFRGSEMSSVLVRTGTRG